MEENGFGIFSMCMLAVYFIPSFVAHVNQKDNIMAIILLNVFLGWTFIGWVVALVWATTINKKQ